MSTVADDSSGLSFRLARPDDAATLVALVNAAYRGGGASQGWTDETALLAGQRTDEGEIIGLMAPPSSLVLLCLIDGRIIGSVHLQAGDGDCAQLGMFVVDPGLQGRGLGKSFMNEAEKLVARQWGARRIAMSVVSLRSELIAFYERRGFRPTGQTKPFPFAGTGSRALVEGIELMIMEKTL